MQRTDESLPVHNRLRDVHVALLRGINVGKAKRIAMADLRALVESLGYSDVRTLLNSGNIVFVATAAKARNATVRIAEAARPRTAAPNLFGRSSATAPSR